MTPNDREQKVTALIDKLCLTRKLKRGEWITIIRERTPAAAEHLFDGDLSSSRTTAATTAITAASARAMQTPCATASPKKISSPAARKDTASDSGHLSFRAAKTDGLPMKGSAISSLRSAHSSPTVPSLFLLESVLMTATKGFTTPGQTVICSAMRHTTRSITAGSIRLSCLPRTGSSACGI